MESNLLSDNQSMIIRLLCPKQWTVCADSILSILDNYQVLLSTWEKSREVVRDTESKARIHGVYSQMNTFDVLFGTMLGEIVLRHTDNLSKTLQDKTCSSAEGQEIASMVSRTLQAIRTDKYINLFWLKVTNTSKPLDIEPQLPRRCKFPKTYYSGTAEGEFHMT